MGGDVSLILSVDSLVELLELCGGGKLYRIDS